VGFTRQNRDEAQVELETQKRTKGEKFGQRAKGPCRPLGRKNEPSFIIWYCPTHPSLSFASSKLSLGPEPPKRVQTCALENSTERELTKKGKREKRTTRF